jgi:hypothetical protein
VDKDLLFKARLPEDDVEIPGVGTVRVRGLSRHEMLVAGRQESRGVEAMERLMLHFAMVDPVLTEDEVARWQKCSPANELSPVVTRINELSGIGKDAQKEAYKSLRDGSEPGVRVLPGAEAVDDSGPAAAGDAG